MRSLDLTLGRSHKSRDVASPEVLRLYRLSISDSSAEVLAGIDRCEASHLK